MTSSRTSEGEPGGQPLSGRHHAARLILERQVLHWLSLALLLGAIIFLYQEWALAAPGEWLGLSAELWFIAAVLSPILHQHFVLLGWRLELHLGWWSRRFGDDAFNWFSRGFEVLILSRLVTILGLAVATRGTMELPIQVRFFAIVGLLSLTLWLAWSVVRFFGFARARGADHFFEEYRHLPLCDDGIFRFIPNSMYTVGFAPLWALAFAFESELAFLACAFTQVYIWVHYFCTEVPDMNRIYGQKTGADAAASADQVASDEREHV